MPMSEDKENEENIAKFLRGIEKFNKEKEENNSKLTNFSDYERKQLLSRIKIVLDIIFIQKDNNFRPKVSIGKEIGSEKITVIFEKNKLIRLIDVAISDVVAIGHRPDVAAIGHRLQDIAKTAVVPFLFRKNLMLEYSPRNFLEKDCKMGLQRSVQVLINATGDKINPPLIAIDKTKEDELIFLAAFGSGVKIAKVLPKESKADECLSSNEFLNRYIAPLIIAASYTEQDLLQERCFYSMSSLCENIINLIAVVKPSPYLEKFRFRDSMIAMKNFLQAPGEITYAHIRGTLLELNEDILVKEETYFGERSIKYE